MRRFYERSLLLGVAAMATMFAVGSIPQAAMLPTRIEIGRIQRPVRRRRPFRRLNRSQRWAHADSYEDARRISPFPHRPVR